MKVRRSREKGKQVSAIIYEYDLTSKTYYDIISGRLFPRAIPAPALTAPPMPVAAAVAAVEEEAVPELAIVEAEQSEEVKITIPMEEYKRLRKMKKMLRTLQSQIKELMG